MKKILTLILLLCLLKTEAQTSVQPVNCGGHNLYVRITFADSIASEFFPTIIICPDGLPHYDTAETVFVKCKMELFGDAACTQPIPADPRFFAFDPNIPSTGDPANPAILYNPNCSYTLPTGSAYSGNYRIDYYQWYLRRCIYECTPTPTHQCFSTNPGTVFYNVVINCCFEPRILSVQLMDFAGVRSSSVNSLSWKLAGGTDLSRLELERSFDGVSFSTMYTTSDPTITNYLDGVNRTAYYRLKIYNTSGGSFYSPVVLLRANIPITAFSVWPSPFKEVLNVTVPVRRETQAFFRIIAADGRTMFSIDCILSAGMNNLSFKVPVLCPGVYMLQMRNGDGTYTRKIVKQ